MIKKYIQNLVWNWDLMQNQITRALQTSRTDLLHDLCSRISIQRMREMLDEAEQSHEKFTTLARLLEDNYKK